MHIVTPESIDYQLRLLAELAWLKQEHPDKTALIGLAENTALAWKAFDRDAFRKRFGGLP